MIDIFKYMKKKDISPELQFLQTMKIKNVFYLTIFQKSE